MQQAEREEFREHWPKVSRRPDPARAFWALLPGSVWTAAAIRAAAENPEPFPCYCEIYLPTLLYHLGFRIRHWEDCPLQIHGGGNLRSRMDQLRAAGYLAAHPVK